MAIRDLNWTDLDTSDLYWILEAAPDDLFDNQPYVHLLHNGNPTAAIEHGIKTLDLCRSINRPGYQKIHKGTPFYWIGTAAFLISDFQTAAYFFDAAVSEDLRRSKGRFPTSPAIKFVTLNGDAPDQAARSLTIKLQKNINKSLENYNSIIPSSESPLTIDEIRRFLWQSVRGATWRRSLATAFISFFLEYDHRARLIPLVTAPGSGEPFIMHLLKGTTLFESLIKSGKGGITKNGTLTKILADQTMWGALGFTQKPKFKNSQSLASVARMANNPQQSIIIATRIRNAVAHNLRWRISRDIYDRAFIEISRACMHAIARLH